MEVKSDIKKMKTKKALKKYYALNRCKVGLGRNLGSIEHKNAKKYDRKQGKKELLASIDL